MAPQSPFRTSTDLITEALANLNVLASGQNIDPEDFNFVGEKWPALVRTLAALEIVYVTDTNNIPGAWFGPLADILAGECASKFGFNGQAYIDKVNRGLGGAGGTQVGTGTAAVALKIITRGRPTYERMRSESF